MVKYSIVLLLGLVVSAVHATPLLEKRIAQVIDQSTAQWEQACVRPFFVATYSDLINLVAFCGWRPAMQSPLRVILLDPPRWRRTLRSTKRSR